MGESRSISFSSIIVEQHTILSEYLEREVVIDVYLPTGVPGPEPISLLLINDGQDLIKMPFDEILDELITKAAIQPLVCIGIHCGPDRKMEYGTAYSADYRGRGATAGLYTKFLFDE